MKFLIDENIRIEIMDFLTEKGHDVKRVPCGMENGDVMSLATNEQRILITHDIHFSNILIYPPAKYSGIIRIKIHPPTLEKITNALSNLLGKISSNEFKKKLFILEEDKFRIRK